jgi:hypothetical protein
MLSWGRASDQIKNASSLAGDLSFLLFGLESPFDLCYWVGHPQLRERSTTCLMTWRGRWSRMDPSHHIWLLWQSHPTIGLILIAIGIETEYRFVTRSLSEWSPKWEPNAPIAAESEVMDFLRLLKLIWQLDSSIIAITVGSEVADFCYGWRYHAASFKLAVPYWLDLNKFLLRWWHIAYWSLNTHQFWSVSLNLSHRFAPAVGLCWSLGWSGVRFDEEESDFIVVDLLIVE